LGCGLFVQYDMKKHRADIELLGAWLRYSILWGMSDKGIALSDRQIVMGENKKAAKRITLHSL
jgi:hypothetical protein